MKVLGISGSLIYPTNHDCATALVIDGKLVENLEEERFNRIKHSVGKFPILTIKEVLRKHNLKLEDIDAIGIPFDIKTKDKYIKQFIELVEPNCKKIPQFFYKTHHTAHAYDAFYQSGFETAASLVIDGSGDLRDGITLGHFTKDGYKVLRVYDISQSLGEMYATTCSYVGLSNNGFGEGKLMGLAPFGKPTEIPLLYWNESNKNIELNYQLISEELEHNDIYAGMLQFMKKKYYPYTEGLCGNPTELDKEDDDYMYEKYNNCSLLPEVMYYQNAASTCQKAFNEIYLGLVKYIKELTGEDNLVLSGGCIQNCIGNNVIVESGIFKNVFATPAPYDGGCAVGLAFYASECIGDKPIGKRTTISYTGRTYTNDEIMSVIDKNEFDVIDYDEKLLIKCLYDGDIFAWFQGGSEIGPRALGHRSIIASPHMRENLTRINLLIKERELFRPLAPSITDELFDKVFDTNSKDLTEFMLRTIEIRQEYRSKLPAICHIDNTARPQCLRKEDNPEFYSLLMSMYNEYKIPCLINTSFNGKGQPIIETPEQAIQFLRDKPELEGIIFNGKLCIFRK